MGKENDESKSEKRELALDILATTLMDVFALAGIVSVIPYTSENLIGAISLMLIFAILGVAYTGVVIGDDRKKLKREQR